MNQESIRKNAAAHIHIKHKQTSEKLLYIKIELSNQQDYNHTQQKRKQR